MDRSRFAWGNTVRYNHKGEAVSMLDEPSREFVIINKKLKQAEYQKSSFVGGGDSGSFVRNEYREVTGLLFGGTQHQRAMRVLR